MWVQWEGGTLTITLNSSERIGEIEELYPLSILGDKHPQPRQACGGYGNHRISPDCNGHT
jgi:hypothetical protein